MLANTFLGHDAPCGTEDTPVGADGNNGVHFRAADSLASTERVHGGFSVGVFVSRLEMGNLGAAKDGFEGKLDEELGGGSKEGGEGVSCRC